MSITIVMILLKVTVLGLLAWLAAALLRHRSAALRHLVWTACLLGMLFVPAIAFGPALPILPDWSAAEPTSTDEAARPMRPAAVPTWPPVVDTTEDAGVTTPTTTPVRKEPVEAPRTESAPVPAAVPPAPSPSLTTGQWLGLAWGMGAFVLALRLLFGWRALWRIARSSREVDAPVVGVILDAVRRDLGVDRGVELRFCAAASGPMTWGVRRPVIALPEDAGAWPVDRLRSVLLHEVAHVARRDAAWQLLARFATIVYWFHPLAWVASRKVHLEQERACDDAVLRAGVKASGYAEDLMGIAATLRPIPAAALVSTAIAGPSELMSRMQYMLDGSRTRGVLTPMRRCGAVACVAIAAVVLGAAQPAQDKKMSKLELASRLVGVLDLPTHRDQAIKELAELGRVAVPALRNGLASKKASVATGAVAALSKSTAPKVFLEPILVDRLTDQSPPKAVRVAIAKVLGPRLDANPRIFAAFFAILDESSDQDLTLEVIHHLTGSKKYRKQVGERLAKRAAKPAEKPTEKPEDSDAVRKANEFRLEVDRLINCLDTRFLRRGATRDLRKLGEKAVPQLIAAILDKNQRPRRAVLQVLCQPRPQSDDVTSALLAAMQKVKAHDRRMLVMFLGGCVRASRVGTHDALQFVQKPGNKGRADVVPILASLTLQRAHDVNKVLVPLLPKADVELAKAIVRGFARHPDHGSGREHALTGALHHKHPEVVAAAVHDILHYTEIAEKVAKDVAELESHGDAAVRKVAQDFAKTLKIRRNFQFQGLIVADYSDNRVVELDKKGKEVFVIEEIFGCWDAEVLANGNLLITEFSVNRVMEVRRKDRKVVWKFEDLKNPYDADRLPNGNTLIADTFGRRVIEVNKKGEIVWKYDKSIHPYDVDRLPNGNTLIADTHDDRVIEVDKDGKIVWQIKKVPNVHDADRLPNGNTLLTIRMLNEVREVDKDGKTVMSLKNLSSPSDADRLSDGTTMVAENGMVRIFSPSGTVVWKKGITWAVEVNAVPKKK